MKRGEKDAPEMAKRYWYSGCQLIAVFQALAKRAKKKLRIVL